ncbi:MAG: hypothetical protein NE327_07100 [Lentisphaeraceae bacterium]|nr:hypothetical protein [Lentisphaeraceae bacterium]
MIFISRFSRVLTIVLCLLYIFTGSGLDKLTYQGVSLIYRTAVFKCKGKGCQCDKAGYELPNCQCDHENNVSCCSTENTVIEVEESCCSETPGKPIGEVLSNLPCQGVDESEVNSLSKHLLFLPHFGEEVNNTSKSAYSPYKTSILEVELQSKDKVPILS